MSTTVTYKGSTLTTVNNETKKLTTKGTWLEDDITITASGITPSGTKTINIFSNGTTTHDVSAFASAQVIASVPNTYSAADAGMVVSGLTLVSQGSSTFTSNATYDTTFLSAVTVSVAGSVAGVVTIVDTLDSAGGTIREITTNSITLETLSVSSNGTYSASSNHAFNVVDVNVAGGGNSREDEILNRTISGTYENSNIHTIGRYAFTSCVNLISVNCPNVTRLEYGAFYACYSLETASLPKVDTMESNAFGLCSCLTEAIFPSVANVAFSAFRSCTNLSVVSFPIATLISDYAFGSTGLTVVNSTAFPMVTSLYAGAFQYCQNLTSVNFPRVSFISASAFISCINLSTVILNYSGTADSAYISTSAFWSCYNLLSLYVLGSVVPHLLNLNVFGSTPIGLRQTSTGGVPGSIFVKESLYSLFSSATNWATCYASGRIVSLTDAQVANVIANGTHVM